MAPDRGLVLGDVFSPCEVLAVPARLELAALLAVLGRTPAVLPADLAALPVYRQLRVEVRNAVVTGLDSAAVDMLSERHLRDVCPAMVEVRGAFLVPDTSARLQSLIERNGAATWARLGELTLTQVLDWPGVGPRMAIELIGALVGGLVDRGEASGPSRGTGGVPARAGSVGSGSNRGIEDLAILAGYEGGRGLAAAIEGLRAEPHPEQVRAAAARLLAGLRNKSHPCLARLDDLLATAGDDRGRAVFEHRMVRPGPRATLAELGAALGIGTERVRQLCRRAVDAVTAAFDHDPGELAVLGAAAVDELGTAAPTGAVAGFLARQNLPALPDSRSSLLLWLAGPYTVIDGHPGWFSTDPVTLMTETTLALLEDGGVRPAEHVTKELERQGINHEHVDAWLAEQAVRMVDDLVVSTHGAAGQVAERVLSATGRAMTAAELSTFTDPAGTDGGVGGLRALLHRDRRFTWVGDDRFELAEWGGGDVSPSDPAVETPTDGLLELHVEVDDGVLGGSIGPVPLPFVEALGLRTGDRRSFPTRYGPVALRNDGATPTRGSVRPVALAVGASAGDVLVLGFHPGQDEVVVTCNPVGAAMRTSDG